MHKGNRTILTFLFVFFGMALTAQQQLADSIRLILDREIPDTARAYNMVMLAMYTEPVDLEKAHLIYGEAL